MRRALFCGACALCAIRTVMAILVVSSLACPSHGGPKWEVRSSVAVEAVCFMNALVGDPYYLRFFSKDYEQFQAQFTPDVRAALSRLYDWKNRDQIILSSRLLTLIPDLTDKTLDDLIRAVDRPGERYKMTAEEYARIAPDLRTVFTFLRDAGFEEYWKTHRRSKVDAKISSFLSMSSVTGLVPAIEELLGHPLAAQKDVMTLLVISYVWPNSIALGRYTLVPPETDSLTLLRTVVHELLHAFEAPPGSELERELQSLQRDEFVMEHFRTRNPAYGYNTFDAYIEENIVRALDQCLTERLGIGVNPRWRWIFEVKGMNVFAAALDHLMKREGFPRSGESFSTFYLRMVQEGKVGPGKIEQLYDEYYPWKSILLITGLLALLVAGSWAYISSRRKKRLVK